jgi:hypothetical protein
MKKRTAVKSIRAKCLDCSNDQPKEVRLCPVIKCPLWPYRMGKRPKEDADTIGDANDPDDNKKGNG